MYTLIPEQMVKSLRTEYRARVLILLFLFLSLGVWIGIVSLFPSYVISATQEKRAVAQAGSVEQSAQSASTTAAIADISSANAGIAALIKGQDTLTLSSLVEDIVQRRVPGVAITDFEVGMATGTATNIHIQGKAATRNDLVAFEDNLKEDTRFSKVDLPVSDLAADTNIFFSMDLTGLQ